MQIFYDELNDVTGQMIDSTTGGTLNSKTPEATQELFEEMVMNDYQWCTYQASQQMFMIWMQLQL